MPSSPISPMGATISCGNFSSASQRRALGMISRSHISRTEACRTRCSSDSSKSIMACGSVFGVLLGFGGLAGLGGTVALFGTGGRKNLHHDGLVGAGELGGVRLPVGDMQRFLGAERDLLAS